MRVHFIAIGGSAMHNLAIALKKKGYNVSGSDDEIFEPSKTRLAALGLLPEKEGWYPEKITTDIEAVILGMHARQDNPELIKARELGLKIYSYPEFLYQQASGKERVVIGGSHGKTTITSMILHVLQNAGIDFDYMVGAQLEGFDTMVKLTESAPFAIFEGDEYLASPIDRRPKFILYKADLALISGIAWDHINVFPTFESYKDQFRAFIKSISDHGTLVYCTEDKELEKLVHESGREDLLLIPYSTPKYVIENGQTSLIIGNGEKIGLRVFGEHNLMNLEGARMICKELGVSDRVFYEHASTFKGASKRLELIASNDKASVYKDFAHSPSKLKATTEAVKKQFPERELIACMELHTFSSLNENFLNEYAGAMDKADVAYVYFSPHTIEHKKLKPISEDQVKKAFKRTDLKVFTDSKKLMGEIKSIDLKNKTMLFMTSGNFDGVDLNKFGNELIKEED